MNSPHKIVNSNRTTVEIITPIQRILWQKLFAQYLRVLGLIFRHTRDLKLIKMLNETFITADFWRRLVDILTVQLFTCSAHGEQDGNKTRLTFFTGTNFLHESSTKLKEIVNDTITDILYVLDYYVALCHLLQLVIREEHLNKKHLVETESQHYWKKSIRKTVQEFAYILKPTEGTLAKFLCASSSYLVLTNAVLNLVASFFCFGPRFFKKLNEEWSLFYIRTHYLSVIRLYNKGMQAIEETERLEATELCKAHIKCLLAIAKNRNEETSRNFYKMRCVEFLTREIDYEYNSILNKKTDEVEANTQPLNQSEFKEDSDEESITEPAMNNPPKKILKTDFQNKFKLNLGKCNIEMEEVKGAEEIKEVKHAENSNDLNESGEEIKKEISDESDETLIQHTMTEVSNETNSKRNKSTSQIVRLSHKSKTNIQRKLNLSKITKASISSPKVDTKPAKVIKKSILINLKDQKNLKFNKETGSLRLTIKSPTEHSSKIQIRPQSRNNVVKVPVDTHKSQLESILSSPQIEQFKEEPKRAVRLISSKGSKRVERIKKVFAPSVGLSQEGKEAKSFLKNRPCENLRHVKRREKTGLNKTLIQSTLDRPKIILSSKKEKSPNINSSTTSIKKEHIQLAPPKEKKDVKKEQRKDLPEEFKIDLQPCQKKAKIPLLKLPAVNTKDNDESEDTIPISNKPNNEELHTEKESPHNDIKAQSSVVCVIQPKETTNVTRLYELPNELSGRNIYSDPELHALMLGLLFALLLKPPRGILDELYCSTHPSDDGKQNILHLLHFHLNHPTNQLVLPHLWEIVSQLNPPLSGQRLLKLLCGKFFDVSLYTGWRKIAAGAYGTVFECSTNLLSPSSVAVKQLSFPNTIYDRCVLYDIFNEVTALQELRSEGCATTLYDYGVDNNNYYLVMKRYPNSLREWRRKQEESMEENLPLYLHVFKQVLRVVEIVHSKYVSHYDIKCDNFLLEPNSDDTNVALGDFGECKLFTSEKDEHDLKPRGTECIKSPEMLTLTINARKDTDEYDRRKKVGTTRASDIWSLGCLLYELLTGEYLFSSEDFVSFYIKVTSENEAIFSEEQREMLGNNIYLMDFLNFLLIREPTRRPDISKVVKRFKHVYALLVGSGMNALPNIVPGNWAKEESQPLESLLESCEEIMRQEIIQDESTNLLNANTMLVQLMENIYLCSHDYLYKHKAELIESNHITHLILPECFYRENVEDSFVTLKVSTCSCKSIVNPYNTIPTILDYLRKVALNTGKVLFVDDISYDCPKCATSSKGFIRQSLLITLGHILQMSGYEIWTLCNSQSLLPVSQATLSQVSKWLFIISKLTDHISNYPKYSCICGNCTFILTRGLPESNTLKSCNCSAKYTKSPEYSDCPSHGCAELLEFIENHYGISWEQIKWGYFDQADFLVGPNSETQIQRAIVGSEGVKKNSVCCGVNEKAQSDWETTNTWLMYQCKVCNVWTHAMRNNDNKVALVMNNLLGNLEYIIIGRRIDVNKQCGNLVNVSVLSNISFKLPL